MTDRGWFEEDAEGKITFHPAKYIEDAEGKVTFNFPQNDVRKAINDLRCALRQTNELKVMIEQIIKELEAKT